MEGGNLDIPPPLVQLGFSAYESTGLCLFCREGKGEKYTAITCVQQKRATATEMSEEVKVKLERGAPPLSGSRTRRSGCHLHMWHWSALDSAAIAHLVNLLTNFVRVESEYGLVLGRGWHTGLVSIHLIGYSRSFTRHFVGADVKCSSSFGY